MLSLLRRFGERCSDLSEQYIPDPYVIAIVLTFVATLAALVTGATPREALSAWTGSVWSLLPFMAAISVLLMTGDAVAKSAAFTAGLERLARLPNYRFSAVWFTSFVAVAAALVSWAIGLIVAAIVMLVFAILSFFVTVFIVDAGAGLAGLAPDDEFIVLSAAILATGAIVAGASPLTGLSSVEE
jgi:short subunit fatty acids transporter